MTSERQDRPAERTDVPPSVQSRDSILQAVVADIVDLGRDGFTRVGVDGVDGAGKSVFAAELMRHLESAGVAAVGVSIDGYHRPAAVRYRKGRSSPEGFFADSYDYPRFISQVLDPFGDHGDGRFIRAIHDTTTDRAIERVFEQSPENAVLVVDGIFLHRSELVGLWDYSIFLDVDFAVSIPRMAGRDGTPSELGAEYNRRYIEGQRIYLERCRPAEKASVVIDNTDIDSPRIVVRG